MERVALRRAAMISFLLFACVFGAFVEANCQELPSTRFKLTAAAMVGLGAVDVAQTTIALRSQQFREGNPALVPFVSRPWLLASVKAGAFVGTWAITRRLRQQGHGRAAWGILLGVTAAQGCAVAWNTRQLYGRR